MFRRRTDQVYATLQQVQRRITEQSGQPGQANGEVTLERKPTSAPVQPFAPLQPLQDALARQKPPLVGHQPEPPPLPSQLAAIPKGGIVFSISLAVTLSVLWIASCALCFVLGLHASDRRTPGEGFGPGDSGSRAPANTPPSQAQAQASVDAPTPVAKPEGPWVLVLQSKPDWTPEDESLYRRTANQHNEVARAHSAEGWRAWFGVRKPNNGSLQLVFGEVSPGQFGVKKSDWDKFAKSLATSRYPQATWLDSSRAP